MDWIIGGTKDSREFLDLIKNNNIDLANLVISVATEYGRKLVQDENLKVVSKPMNEIEMIDFIEKNSIKRIFDFSHPYAIDVSKNAISAAKERKIKYYRFERENLNQKDAINFKNIDELVDFIETLKGNILVTLGSNNIKSFEHLTNLENIYFRVLPVTISLKKLEDVGIKAKNIIGLQGPFSKEFNKAIYKNYKIKYVVTKESGATGGEKEKLEAADELNITPIVLKRPPIDYPWVTSKLIETFNIFIEQS